MPGKPEESPLYLAVTWEELEMPPKENDRLSARADRAHPPMDRGRGSLARRGDPEDVSRGGMDGGVHGRWRDREDQRRTRGRVDLSPLQARGHLVVPTGREAGGSDPSGRRETRSTRSSKRSGPGAAFEPAPQADPLTLIRRASYDLIGLPPTPTEIESFQVDWAKDAERAWTDLIDRLLASPHYGERWGRHWLDVARYADTGGYSNDYERSNAWRYRDYVIRSFNVDKPYDRFIVEQIAGDELADASVRQRSQRRRGERVKQARLKGDYTPEESEWIVATSFLRMGPWDNAMVKSPEARQILPRRRGQLRRPDVPLDHDALPEVSRPQVRPDPDPRLLPDVRRLRGHADGRAARAVPRRGKPGRVRRRETVR